MLVGEAPGRHEEKVNIPFSGASGQELMKLIESIGYSRSTVYITSVVTLWMTKALMIVVFLPMGLIAARILTDSKWRHNG